MNTATKLKGYIFTVMSAVIYGTMPLMARHIYADGVNALTLVSLRNLLALPSIAVMVWLTEKSFKIERGMFFKVSLPSILGCAITPVLLFASYNYLASGTSTVFHFIYPAVVVLIGIIFMKQKANIKTIAVTWGFNTKEKLSKENPDYLADSPMHLLEALQSLRQ